MEGIVSEIQKIRARVKKRGLPPGVLLAEGNRGDTHVPISVMEYGAESFNEKTDASIEDCIMRHGALGVLWINVDGNQNPGIVAKIGECFGIHPLVLEDIMTSGQRPKLEDHGEYLAVILKMIYPGKKKHEILDEQLSLIIGKNYVISFQESPGGDPFEAIRERLRANLGRIRTASTDFLAYTLMDVIIDNYFVILENLGEEIETIEEETIQHPIPGTLKKTYDLKRTLIFFRKYVWPLREVIGALNRSESALVAVSTKFYFRDAYDHVIQLIDSIETYRDLAATIVEIYLSNVSNRTNESVKRLTAVATICMPLGVIAGIGGMSEWSMMTGSGNWMISYPLFILGLGVLGICTFLFFKWKRWL
jgi:magnesium transporter